MLTYYDGQKFEEMRNIVALRSGHGIRNDPRVVFALFKNTNRGIYTCFTTTAQSVVEEVQEQTQHATDMLSMESNVRFINCISSDPLGLELVELMNKKRESMRIGISMYSYWCDYSIHQEVITIEMLIASERNALPLEKIFDPYNSSRLLDTEDEMEKIKCILKEIGAINDEEDNIHE